MYITYTCHAGHQQVCHWLFQKLNAAHLTLQGCTMSTWMNRWARVFRGDSNNPFLPAQCTSTRFEESKLIKVTYCAAGTTPIPNPAMLQTNLSRWVATVA